jgi:hypothetical protein
MAYPLLGKSVKHRVSKRRITKLQCVESASGIQDRDYETVVRHIVLGAISQIRVMDINTSDTLAARIKSSLDKWA